MNWENSLLPSPLTLKLALTKPLSPMYLFNVYMMKVVYYDYLQSEQCHEVIRDNVLKQKMRGL